MNKYTQVRNIVNTYRDLFKWGNPNFEEPLEKNLVKLLGKKIGLQTKKFDDLPGSSEISPIKINELDREVIKKISKIVGHNDWTISTNDLLSHGFGKSFLDTIRIRRGIFKNIPQMVVYPKSEREIKKILKICNDHNLPIIPEGGLTSVTQGIEFEKGGIAMDLTKHMNNIVDINVINSTVTVQTGTFGPALEDTLRNHKSEAAPNGFTCGHFPQSFEYSTVGGWVATRGAGQESTGFGKIEDLVLGLEIITPRGKISFPVFPAKATGPELIQTIIGSEGALGVITQVTMKIQKYSPYIQKAAILFKNWTEGISALRKIMQSGFGRPYLFRLSDPDETNIYLEIGGIKSWQEWLLNKLGYHSNERVLLLCSTRGTKSYAKSTMRQIKHIAKSFGGRIISSSVVDRWIKDRFQTPYLRDTLVDHGIIVDTLETSVTWDKIYNLWENVRNVIISQPNTICMAHISHLYETGANLYFTYMRNPKNGISIEKYQNLQHKIIKSIIDNGGSLSHHHGIGRLFKPYLETEFGKLKIELLKKIKNVLDPNNIMNPGILL